MDLVSKQATQLLILHAAEELFSIHGYYGTSLREITRKAGVNLAAVNYHFEGKEALFCDLLRMRLGPINRDRIEKLTRSQQAHLNALVPIESIIDFFARPLFQLCADTAHGGHHFARIIGQSITLSLPFVTDLLASDLHPVTTRFAQAIRRHVPHLTPEDFMWRLNFVVGALHHTLATAYRMKELTRGICHGDDPNEMLQRFIPFAVTSLTAPSPL
jgi:AcrR family transcriptional regulator